MRTLVPRSRPPRETAEDGAVAASRIRRAASPVAAAVILLAVLLVAVTDAGGSGTNAGDAVVVDPATNEAMPAGGSQTVWSFKLPPPPGSNCSGDSATDEHFVYSYMTPAANDPGDLTFNPSDGPNQPDGSWAYPLFEQSG